MRSSRAIAESGSWPKKQKSSSIESVFDIVSDCYEDAYSERRYDTGSGFARGCDAFKYDARPWPLLQKPLQTILVGGFAGGEQRAGL